MEELTQAIVVFIRLTIVVKEDLDIQKFFGKVKEVIPFISNIETVRRANGWNDKKNPKYTLVKGEEYTSEELFTYFIAQVNKVRLYFRDATVIWWQNLKDKLYTWEDFVEVDEQEVDDDILG